MFATIITIGGMKVIGYTDVIQVVVLIIGGLATTYIALDAGERTFGLGRTPIAGFKQADDRDADDHFHMMLWQAGARRARQTYISKYLRLPGGHVLRRPVGRESQLLGLQPVHHPAGPGRRSGDGPQGPAVRRLPQAADAVIVMLPGIAAYVLHQNGQLQRRCCKDGEVRQRPGVLGHSAFLPDGLRGLSVAALTAAIVASLAGKANSIATIFTLDIYKKYINRERQRAKAGLDRPHRDRRRR